MQTIEEYRAYTKQLEGEVGKWRHAYDALLIERNALVSRLLELGCRTVDFGDVDGTARVALLRTTFDAMAAELEELRKHEVEWGLAKALVKELENQPNKEGEK